MLQITIPSIELWDELNEEFVSLKETTLVLEHSLVSLSKWEAKWNKPFLGKEDKTQEEIIDYIKCMTVTQNVDPRVYTYMTTDNIKTVNEYISAPMTATTFSEDNNTRRSGERITSELIYYWMIALNIPFECQKWHLNRLLTLVRICNIKNQPPKKQSTKQLLQSYAALNAANRRKYGSSG